MTDHLQRVYSLKDHYRESLHTEKNGSNSVYNHKYTFKGGVDGEVRTGVQESFPLEDTDLNVSYAIEGLSNGVMLLTSHSFDEIERALSKDSI